MDWIKCAACDTPYVREPGNGTVFAVSKACMCDCNKVVECERPDEYTIYVGEEETNG